MVGAVLREGEALGRRLVVALVTALHEAVGVAAVVADVVAVVALLVHDLAVSTVADALVADTDGVVGVLAERAYCSVEVAADCAVGVIAGQVAVGGVDQRVVGQASHAEGLRANPAAIEKRIAGEAGVVGEEERPVGGAGSAVGWRAEAGVAAGGAVAGYAGVGFVGAGQGQAGVVAEVAVGGVAGEALAGGVAGEAVEPAGQTALVGDVEVKRRLACIVALVIASIVDPVVVVRAIEVDEGCACIGKISIAAINP